MKMYIIMGFSESDNLSLMSFHRFDVNMLPRVTEPIVNNELMIRSDLNNSY